MTKTGPFQPGTYEMLLQSCEMLRGQYVYTFYHKETDSVIKTTKQRQQRCVVGRRYLVTIELVSVITDMENVRQ